MAITIRDVAEAAGVSPTAVSKVLHGRGENVRVGPSTALHIRQIAEQLNYQPNQLALSFRTKRTNSIGLVFEQFDRIDERTGYFTALLNGIMAAAFREDFSLTICPKLLRDSEEGLLFDGRFDGIIWGKPEVNEQARMSVSRLSIPVVAMHLTPEWLDSTPTFCCDNAHGLDLAVRHLAELGHTKIGFAIDHGNRALPEGLQRIDGFFTAMQRASLSARPSDLMVWDHQAVEFADLVRSGEFEHTALICFSESHSLNLLESAQKLGMKLPDELSIIGFDSTDICNTVSPKMTAISQPVEAMAFDATKKLIDLINGKAESETHFVYPCGLDIRESTARPPLQRRGDYSDASKSIYTH